MMDARQCDGTCPDCGQPVTRDQPAWGPRGGPVHHDPCPIPPGEPCADCKRLAEKYDGWEPWEEATWD